VITRRVRRGLRLVLASIVSVAAIASFAAAPSAAADDDNDGWDPRLVEVAHAVEELRGLKFEHPVPVHRLTDEEFKREVTGGKITARDRREWNQASQALTALGFMDHPVELEALQDDTGAFYGGYYDSYRKEIVVRHEKLTTPSMRALLAHELTHALQDQHFSLNSIDKRSRRSDVPRALVEGDADNIESLYIDEKLTEREREELYSSGNGDDSEEEDDGGPTMPIIFELQRTEPYRLGSRMVWVLEATGEVSAVDAALRKPPVDDVAFLDPRALLDPQSIDKVPPPQIDPTERRRGISHALAPDLLYLMLAERMPPRAALQAAERWGGGRYQLVDAQGTPCVRASIVGRNGYPDAAVIANALTAWGEGRPGANPATVTGDTVTFLACVPAGNAPAVQDAVLVQAFEHLALRYDITDVGLRQGMSLPTAICAADELLARPGVTGPLATITSFDGEYPSALVETLRAALDPLVTPPTCR